MNKTTIENLYLLLLQGSMGPTNAAGVWRNFIAGDFSWAFGYIHKMSSGLVATK